MRRKSEWRAPLQSCWWESLLLLRLPLLFHVIIRISIIPNHLIVYTTIIVECYGTDFVVWGQHWIEFVSARHPLSPLLGAPDTPFLYHLAAWTVRPNQNSQVQSKARFPQRSSGVGDTSSQTSLGSADSRPAACSRPRHPSYMDLPAGATGIYIYIFFWICGDRCSWQC